MKLHLPSSLRKALLLSLGALAVFSTSAQAEIMHNSATLLTYTDLASNMGRYSVYEQNALLRHLNSDEMGGVRISFTQGEQDYKLEHGIISFESTVDGGPFTAIGYNVTATVQHNGVTNPVFTGRFIGTAQAVHYAGIEYRSCKENKFLLTPQTDYKITRLSKVVTDITPSGLFDTEAFLNSGGNLKGQLQYHMGGGYQQRADAEGNTTWLREAYVYVTAGIVEMNGFSRETKPGTVDGRGIADDSYTISMTGVMGEGEEGWGPGTAGTPSHPLPYITQGGDSGSPVWIWNEANQAYELIACHQARGGYNSYARGASDWTKDTLELFNNHVDLSKEGCTSVVHITAVNQQDEETISDIANGSQAVSTTPWHGKVVLSNGEKIDFVGVQSGINTWNNLRDLKDGDKTDASGKIINWYAYGNEYLNSTYNEGGKLEYADLFMTENLNFQSSAAENTIILDADVDLGIGYAQFSAKGESENVSYTIQGDNSNNSLQFNHAGYVIDEGVSVHVKLVNGTDYYREWRKVGEGDLHLEGQGENHIFLNVGGTGTTYLKENGGYAAYNVLINNGAAVNLDGNKGQVERDVTFGYGGGTLDFAGNVEMVWNNTNGAAADGFSIHALTQDAVVTNTTGTTTLTYTEGGETNFLGSFQDTDASTLNVVYAGGGTWTLNSIHTDLKSGGLTVTNGRVVLAGTNTVHAQGSLNGYNPQRYTNADDWHYADAAMNVTVADGATFELGSHARLTGDVTVNGGGTFLMREGVRHQMEYIEGWYELEDTYEIAAYYGLHGNVTLNDASSKMVVKFSDGTDANTTVTGNITGNGGMTVDTANGSLTLSGNNTFSGEKTVTNGILILSNADAAGTTTNNQWKLQSKAQLLVNGTAAGNALALVDKSSSGVLVLTQDESGSSISMDGYDSLIIGAEAGKAIQFGAENSEYALVAVDGKWNLGGGGGNLVVNYKLNDGSTLVLGNEYTTGSVTLTNTGNHIGAIDFAGKVTLAYTDVEALGRSKINLGYTNRIMGAEGTVALINENSDGVMLLDNMENEDTINLNGRSTLHLGASGDVVYAGDITLDENADTYYFGGITGTLTIDKALTDQNDGYTSLVLDGQTYSGGVLELRQKLEITGSVEVYGHNVHSEVARTGGDATLRLCEDNSLENPYLVTLYEGGILDINGTEQGFTSIEAYEGSKIIDSKGNGVLRINSEGDGFSFLTLAGEVEVGTIDIYSASTLEGTTPLSVSLGGKMTYATMNVSGSSGAAIVASDVLCATGKTVLDSTTLYLGANNATTHLVLDNGTVELGDSGAAGTGELSGAISTVAGTQDNVINFVPNKNGTAGKVSSVVDVAAGSKLTIKGNTARFGSASFAESGGTVVMETSRVNLENSTGTHFGGTLDIKGVNGQMTLHGNGGSDNILREIDKLKVQKDTTLTLQEASWNTIWNIHELTGEGNVTWNSQTTHWYSSRVILGAEAGEDSTFKPDGDMGTYSGTFTAQRNTNSLNEEREYASYVELAHDTIMQNARVNLVGIHKDDAVTSAYMTLAVNTDNGTIQGLDGNKYSALYAGAAVEGGDQKDNQLKYAPVSMRKANLVIKGGDTYDFQGNVYGGEEGTGLSIVMDGEGTQNFSGSDVHLVDVTVNKGTLGFTHATETPDIAGQISIAQGAKLNLANKQLELGAGNVLAVLPGGDTSASAALDGSLLFSGGSLLFSGDAVVNASNGALSLSGSAGIAQGETLTINFSEELSMQAGKNYTLSTGNWSSVSKDSILQGELIYYSAEFFTDSNGLTVTLSNRTDMQVWDGTEQENTWSQTKFGQHSNVLSAEKIAVFNDTAESSAVSITSNVVAGQLLFDNDEKAYTLEATSGNGVTAGALRQVGTATTTLANGVAVSGEARVEAGTLVLDSGSRVGSATVAEAAELRLAAVPSAAPESITGDGRLVVDWNGGTGSLGSTDIAHIEVRSGTLEVGTQQKIGFRESLLVGEQSTLHTHSTAFLAESSKTLPIQLAGALQVDIDSAQDFTYTVISPQDAEGHARKGHIIKTGSGAMTLKSSVSANTVTVSKGSLNVNENALVPDFLGQVGTLEVNSGASATIGKGNFTTEQDGFATNFVVDGKSTLTLSIAQYGSKTIKGNVTVTNGATLGKYDGGLVLEGTTKLGNSAVDEVTLHVTWGKSGWNLAGKVEGAGKVNLTSLGWGGAADTCILSNDENTFDGEFAVHSLMRLAAGSNNALARADVTLDNNGGLYVAAENAHIRNLTGSTGSFVQLNGDKDRTSGTLTVNQTKDTTFAGTIGTNVSLVKEGDAKLTLTGANTYTGGTTVNAGTLVAGTTALGTGPVTLNGGTLNLSAPTTIGAFTMDGGTLVLGGESWITSTGAISLNGGALDLTGISITSGKSYSLASGTAVTVGGDVTFKLQNPALASQYFLMVQNNTLMLQYGHPDPGTALIWDHHTSTDWSNSTIDKNWHVNGGQPGSSFFTPGSDVYFDSSSNNQTVTLTETILAGTVEIQQGVKVTIVDGGHTLNGNLIGGGTYALEAGDRTLPASLALDAAKWTGAVEVSGEVGGNDCSFDGLATANSTVLMSGARFWWNPSDVVVQNANFRLNDGCKDNGKAGSDNTAAMQITETNDGGNYYFAGALSGAGDMAYTQEDGRTARFHLHGDLSAWTGDFVNYNGTAEGNHPTLYLDGEGAVSMGGGIVQQGSGALDVYLGGTLTSSIAIDGAVDGKSGTLKLNVKADTTFNNTVNATGGMVVDGDKTATFKDSATIASLAGAGNVEVDGTDAVVSLDSISGYSGSIILTRGSVETTGTVDLSSGTFNQTGGALAVKLGQSLTLGEASITSAIENGGTVCFTKDISASGLQENRTDIFIGADGGESKNDNHFDGAYTMRSISVVNGGKVNPDNHKVTQGGVEYTLQDDGTAVSDWEDTVNYYTFILHEAGTTLKASTIAATATDHEAWGVTVDVEGATLVVDDFLFTVVARNATIINTEDSSDNIGFLLLDGGVNRLTGQLSDFMAMTWFEANKESALNMRKADGSTYQVQAGEVDFYGAESDSSVTIAATATDEESEDVTYSLGSDRYTVESHKMVKVENGDVTVNNHIKTEVVTTGETTGTLTLANGADAETLNAVHATGGDITFLNMAAGLTVQEVTLADGATVSAYVGSETAEKDEATLTIRTGGHITAGGANSKLNANLVMQTGSTLDVSATGGAGLALGSTLTLNQGMGMSAADYANVAGLLEGETYVLFNGVDGLTLGNTSYEEIVPEQVDAADYYNNLARGQYYLVYNFNGSNVGSVAIFSAVPEPATSTLSLLALAALAARRRRKS